jgi:hypothetical protein
MVEFAFTTRRRVDEMLDLMRPCERGRWTVAFDFSKLNKKQVKSAMDEAQARINQKKETTRILNSHIAVLTGRKSFCPDPKPPLAEMYNIPRIEKEIAELSSERNCYQSLAKQGDDYASHLRAKEYSSKIRGLEKRKSAIQKTLERLVPKSKLEDPEHVKGVLEKEREECKKVRDLKNILISIHHSKNL